VRIALVEPYYGGSHRAWADGYAAHSKHEVELLTLPATFWKWRLQGAHLTLADDFRAVTRKSGHFDLLLASSMLDLAGFLGLVRSELAGAPVVYYVHENQLTYPLSPLDREDTGHAMKNWISMASADLVAFNSGYHLRTWSEALPGFLRRCPDERHMRLVEPVMAGAEVLPVGVDLARLDQVPRRSRSVPLILWNQRWDHDKGPSEFAAALTALAETGVAFEVALAGEQFVNDPPEFTMLRDRLASRLIHYGFASEDRYVELLRAADIVVSTAHQEFFGIAITEAVYAGAFPLLPNRVVYPDRIPAVHHDRCLFDDEAGLVSRLSWALANRNAVAAIASDLRSAMAPYDWGVVGPSYDARFEALVDQ
jgi:glycosyltransferase involved in cell wall biosynthesis